MRRRPARAFTERNRRHSPPHPRRPGGGSRHGSDELRRPPVRTRAPAPAAGQRRGASTLRPQHRHRGTTWPPPRAWSRPTSSCITTRPGRGRCCCRPTTRPPTSNPRCLSSPGSRVTRPSRDARPCWQRGRARRPGRGHDRARRRPPRPRTRGPGGIGERLAAPGQQHVPQDPRGLAGVAVGQRATARAASVSRRSTSTASGGTARRYPAGCDSITSSIPAWRSWARRRETSVCSALPGLPGRSSGQISPASERARHDAPSIQGKQSEQNPQLAAANVDRAARLVPYLKRA